MSSLRTLVRGSGTGSRIFAARTSWTVTALVAADLAGLSVALALATIVVATLSTAAVPQSWLGPELLILAFPVAYFIYDLYPGIALNPIDEFRRLSRATATACVAGVIALALLASEPPSWLLLLAGLIAMASVPVARACIRELVGRSDWWGAPVIILGAGRTAALVIDRLRATPRIGLKPVACLDDDPDKIGTSVYDVPVVGTLADVEKNPAQVARAVIAMPGVAPGDLVRLLGPHASRFDSIILVPNLFGMTNVGVETRDLGGVLGLHVRHNLLNPVNRFAKRVLDIAALLPTLLVALPLAAAGAISIMIVSPGTPFYYQVRNGFGGRPIRVWKLRTMYFDAEARLARHLEHDHDARQEWLRHFKLKDDPRILPLVGNVLRKSSLDEVPQLVNVLLGEMSLVGPRPFPPYHLDTFSEEFRALRGTVQPGITGLWQVSARSDGDTEVQEEFDTYYIRNWSLWMDLYVLVRTPLAVLMARGAR